MSVTRTANPVSGAVLQALTDYDIHHSGNPENPQTPEPPNERADTSATVNNPADWDTEHRRVPPYRPIDYNLRGPERPNGVNPIEQAFIATMFLGVRLLGQASTAWRSTGGKLNSSYFTYKIGGEW